MVAVVLTLQCMGTPVLASARVCCTKAVGSPQSLLYTAYDEDNDGILDHIRYKHTKRRLPQCIIIGVRKGGTRALLEFLNLHPNIQAQKREMHFFDMDENYEQGLEWYRRKMPYSFPSQITIEKTPAYFIGENIPERVHNMNSSVKLIVILRDPTDRAISDYMQIHTNRLAKDKYHESFEELAIDEETGQVRRSYNAIRRSIYYKHMERWLRYFPLKQLHFVSGENLVNNPVEELSKVESFLGIEHKITENSFYFNETRGFYCIHLKKHEKCLAKSKGRTHPDINPFIENKIREFFRPLNQKFYDLVGRDFGWLWKYKLLLMLLILIGFMCVEHYEWIQDFFYKYILIENIFPCEFTW